MAYGLDSMLKEVCGENYKGACKEIFPFNGTLFMVSKWKDFILTHWLK